MPEAPAVFYDVGCDVGGTNTDCAVIRRTTTLPNGVEKIDVVGQKKQTTSADVTSGVLSGASAALSDAGITSAQVRNVFIGTTQFVNAVVERSPALAKVAVIRVGGAGVSGIPAFTTLPKTLREAIFGGSYVCSGGYNTDGSPFSPFDEAEVRGIIEKIKKTIPEVKSIVVSAMFSNKRGDQEQRIVEMIDQIYGEAHIDTTQARAIGGADYVLREHAAILNSTLQPLARTVCSGFMKAFTDPSSPIALGPNSLVFLTQNDGTVCSLENAAKLPIRLVACGPTNSMRGAALLSHNLLRDRGYLTGGEKEVKEVLICDIGGTTSDIGAIEVKSGFPRQATLENTVGGVLLQSRFPQTESLALGGGTKIDNVQQQSGAILIGPKSVGRELTKRAYSFTTPEAAAAAGTTRQLTATDIAISNGHVSKETLQKMCADPSRVRDLPFLRVKECVRQFLTKIEISISRLKTNNADVPLILCGGGIIILPDGCEFAGVSDVFVCPHGGVANAVGAALAELAVEEECVYDLARFGSISHVAEGVASEEAGAADEKLRYDEAQMALRSHVQETLRRKAVEAGAKDDRHLRLTEYVARGLSYMSDDSFKSAVSVVARMVGRIDMFRLLDAEKKKNRNAKKMLMDAAADCPAANSGAIEATEPDTAFVLDPRQLVKDPEVDEHGVWHCSEADIELISMGASVLGCGGGGNVRPGMHRVKAQYRAGHKVTVVAPSAIPAGAECVSVAYFGSPTIMMGMIGSCNEMGDAYCEMCKRLGKDPAAKNNFFAVYSAECGGTNALEPLVLSAQQGMHYLDADAMGRAFPTIGHYLPYIMTDKYTPLTMAGANGAVSSHSPESCETADLALRKYVFETHGGAAGICLPPLNRDEVNKCLPRHTVSLAWRIGRVLHNARVKHTDPVAALVALTKGRLIGVGTIHDAPSRDSLWAAGSYTFQLERGQLGDTFEQCVIFYVNEYLLAKCEKKRDGGADGWVATTPDLIALLDVDTGRNYHCDEVRFGMRLAIVQLPAPSLWDDLPVGAPEGFKPMMGNLVDGVKPVVLPNRRDDAMVSICDEYRKK